MEQIKCTDGTKYLHKDNITIYQPAIHNIVEEILEVVREVKHKVTMRNFMTKVKHK